MTAAAPAARVALVHATALAIAPIQDAFARLWPQARLMNLLDDSLSVDRARDGTLTAAMTQRFVDLAKYAKSTGCEGILFTCSAFGPAIETAGRAVGLPTLKPNEAMFEQALDRAASGSGRIALVATFEASIASMSEELRAMAAHRGQRLVLSSAFVPEAMQDLANGNAQAHHDKVAEGAARLAARERPDVLMLAQFSMSGAQPRTDAAIAASMPALDCPVLTSPDCAVQSLRSRIAHDH